MQQNNKMGATDKKFFDAIVYILQPDHQSVENVRTKYG
jgi:hypothetical protein